MRKYLAEFMGTLIFMLFAGAAIIYLTTFQYSQIFDVMVIYGLTLMTSIFIWGSFADGGYFNPAVTLAAAIRGKISWKTCGGYVVAELVGGIIGLGFTIIAINGVSTIQKSASQNVSTTEILAALHPNASGVLAPYAFGVELVLTFFLVLITLLAFQYHPKFSPFIIGAFLTVTMFAAFPLTGGALNPVRVLAPIVYSSGQNMGYVWIYLLAQLLAGALAGLLLRYFFDPAHD